MIGAFYCSWAQPSTHGVHVCLRAPGCWVARAQQLDCTRPRLVPHWPVDAAASGPRLHGVAGRLQIADLKGIDLHCSFHYRSSEDRLRIKSLTLESLPTLFVPNITDDIFLLMFMTWKGRRKEKEEKKPLKCRFLYNLHVDIVKYFAHNCGKFSKNCYFLACHNCPRIVALVFHVCWCRLLTVSFPDRAAQPLLPLLLLTFCFSGAN